MPPSRRRPNPNSGQVPPVRRPRVAGLRHRPTGQDQPTDQETPETTPEESPEAPASEEANIPETKAPETKAPEAKAPKKKAREAKAQEAKAPEGPAEPEAAAKARPEPATAEPAEPPVADLGSDEPAEPPVVDLGSDEPAESEPAAADVDEDTTTTTAAAEEERAAAERTARHRAQRPAGKRRSTGTTRPADLTTAESDTRATADSDNRPRPHPHRAPRRRGVRNPYPVAAIVAVVAVVFGVLAFWFRGEASALDSRDPNTALTDSTTTSEALGQLTTAVETTLSYNYTDLESTKAAVEASLSETARCEYDMLFKQLLALAPEQKLILATTVRDIGLVRLDGDRAEALVFIDLVSTRVDTNKTVPGEAVFGVRARRDGDSWKITEFNMFDQELVTGEPVPQC